MLAISNRFEIILYYCYPKSINQTAQIIYE